VNNSQLDFNLNVNSYVNQIKQTEASIPIINPEEAKEKPSDFMMYEKTSKGDLVIYDSGAQIVECNQRKMEALESVVYKELDFLEHRKQVASNQFVPLIGVNDAPFKNPYNGSTINFAIENNMLYSLYEDSFKKYDKNRAEADILKLMSIKQKFAQPLKSVVHFQKKLCVPSETNLLEQVYFYSRFESGNLHRVVKKQDKETKTFSGLTISDIDKAKNQ
jgi:hypothetical protein